MCQLEVEFFSFLDRVVTSSFVNDELKQVLVTLKSAVVRNRRFNFPKRQVEIMEQQTIGINRNDIRNNNEVEYAIPTIHSIDSSSVVDNKSETSLSEGHKTGVVIRGNMGEDKADDGCTIAEIGNDNTSSYGKMPKESLGQDNNSVGEDQYCGCLRSSRPYDEDDIKTICDMVCRWFKDPTNFRYYFFGDVDYVEGKDLKLMHGAGIKMAYFIKVLYKGTVNERGQVVIVRDLDSHFGDKIFEVIKDSKSLKSYGPKRFEFVKKDIDYVMKPILEKLSMK